MPRISRPPPAPLSRFTSCVLSRSSLFFIRSTRAAPRLIAVISTSPS